eukprot:16801-Amphidinium_carterae.1
MAHVVCLVLVLLNYNFSGPWLDACLVLELFLPSRCQTGLCGCEHAWRFSFFARKCFLCVPEDCLAADADSEVCLCGCGRVLSHQSSPGIPCTYSRQGVTLLAHREALLAVLPPSGARLRRSSWTSKWCLEACAGQSRS